MFYKYYKNLPFIVIIFASCTQIFSMSKRSVNQEKLKPKENLESTNKENNVENKKNDLPDFDFICQKFSSNKAIYHFSLERKKTSGPFFFPLELFEGDITFISKFDIPSSEMHNYFGSFINGIIGVNTNKNKILHIAQAEETILSQYKKSHNESIKLPLIARYPKLMGGLLCLTTAIATLAGEYTIKNFDLIPKLLALFSYFHQ